MIRFHLYAFVAGFILDLIIGDPHFLYHPVRAIGKFVSFLEKKFMSKEKTSKDKRLYGTVTVLLVCLITACIAGGLLVASYSVNSYAGMVMETIMSWQVLALKCLGSESLKVYKVLKAKDLIKARKALSMIVGRDTENLTEEQVIKACVETVAENASDGVIAPMFYLALGGPIVGFIYKAINTMDSMIGYKDDRHIDYGRCAAKLDDAVNFIPSRLCAFMMIISCSILGKAFSVKNAWKIFRRDRFNHASPNSAQTESVMAGALCIQLAGPASYHGIIEDKHFIGDALRTIEVNDIKRANRLLYVSSFLWEIVFTGILFMMEKL